MMSKFFFQKLYNYITW